MEKKEMKKITHRKYKQNKKKNEHKKGKNQK